MARVNGTLHFAPSLPFAKVDWNGERLPEHFERRISGYYLSPACGLAKAGHAFAAGLIVVCAIDAIAHLQTGTSGVSARIKGFSRKIPGVMSDALATRFCEDFRNGLVHNARVKNGGEFSLETRQIVEWRDERLIVNPLYLAEYTREALRDFVKDLYHDPEAKRRFRNSLRKKFKYEIINCIR